MKRLIVLLAAALSGSVCFISPASARTADFHPSNPSTVVPASGAAPKVLVSAVVRTPTPQSYTVVSGDTLWGIGIRLLGSETAWSELASYNHLANPNLIIVGQVIAIPPGGYTAPAPFVQSTPVHRQYTYAPAKVQVSTPNSHASTSYVPSSGGAPGSFQSCVEFRESTDGAGSSNLYGILPSTWASLGLAGSPYSASKAQQDAAFQMLYARDGVSPWARYDGC